MGGGTLLFITTIEFAMMLDALMVYLTLCRARAALTICSPAAGLIMLDTPPRQGRLARYAAFLFAHERSHIFAANCCRAIGHVGWRRALAESRNLISSHRAIFPANIGNFFDDFFFHISLHFCIFDITHAAKFLQSCQQKRQRLLIAGAFVRTAASLRHRQREYSDFDALLLSAGSFFSNFAAEIYCYRLSPVSHAIA